MKEQFSLLILTYFLTIISPNASPLSDGITPNKTTLGDYFPVSTTSDFDDRNHDCISIRHRNIPTQLNKTRAGEYYLNLKLHDQLRLIFNKACDGDIKCVIYKNSQPSITYTEDVHTIVELPHNYISCVRSSEEYLKIHLFVQNGDKFFTKATFVDFNSTGFFLQCLGGYYAENVKLIVNQKAIDLPYDPMKGFFVDGRTYSRKKLYQCEHGNELIGFSYGDSALSKSEISQQFKMKMVSYTIGSEIQCIIEHGTSDNDYENFIVILACPHKFNCPKLKLRATQGTNTVFAASIVNLSKSIVSKHYCVFMKDGEIVAEAFFIGEGFSATIYVLILVAFGFVAFWIIAIFNMFGRWRYEKVKTNDTFEFNENNLSLEDCKTIGDGNSSVIRVTTVRESGKSVVLKCSQRATQCLKELKILKSLSHVNIITPYGAAILPVKNSWFHRRIQHLVLPYYPEMCLEKFIKKFYPVKNIENVFYSNEQPGLQITLYDMISISWQIARALVYLKEMDVTHRDVAMRNVLISENLICKLTDFERAKKGETRKVSVVENILNVLPKRKEKLFPSMYPSECKKGAFYYSSEVFCYGNLLLELFQFMKPLESCKQIPPLRTQYCPPPMYEIIANCMKEDRKQRCQISSCEASLNSYALGCHETRHVEKKKSLIDEGNRNLFKELWESKRTGYVPLPLSFVPI